MLSKAFAVSVRSILLAVATTGAACAQDYFSSKPIRIFAGSAGGSADFASRLIGEGLGASLGQRPIVDNRGGLIDIRAMIVVKSPPDGLTLMYTSAAMWLAPFSGNVPFDPIRDFTPVVLVGASPAVLVVHPSLPAKNVKELIAVAKARPGDINYGVGALNAVSHLAGELFKTMAGINLIAVPYKGSGPQLTAILSGEVPVTFLTAATAAPHMKTGRLRALGITSPKRSALAPGMPTIAEAGLPGYEMVARYGFLGPAKMADGIVSRLNREISQVLNQPDVRQKFLDHGLEVTVGSPAELASAIQHEMKTLGPIIKQSGARSNN